MERDAIIYAVQKDYKNFNSHAHVERDTMYNTEFTQTLNFNSHAHVERDCKIVMLRNSFFISTHTLTWSVTLWFD